VRFLLDECISARLGITLADAGHEVVHVAACGLAGHVDDEVLAAAREERRVLVSADTDFGVLLVKQSLTLPSLVLCRQGNRSPEHQAATLLGNLDEVIEDLEARSWSSPTAASASADFRWNEPSGLI
jgi:predicted nuclease of predicted toxin-antitoxin system